MSQLSTDHTQSDKLQAAVIKTAQWQSVKCAHWKTLLVCCCICQVLMCPVFALSLTVGCGHA